MMRINNDGTVDNTGLTPEQLQDELLSSPFDYSGIWDGDIAELF